MAKYRYIATESGRASIKGEIEAETLAAARTALEQRGLAVDDLVEMIEEAATADTAPSLSRSDATELTGHLAQIGRSSLPLSAGLRAAAAECGHRRVTDSLRQIAGRVDQGQTLEDVVGSSPELFPRHVGGLVIAATRTGKLGPALTELLEHQRSSRSLRHVIARGFAYPAFVSCFAILILLAMLFSVASTYEKMFNEFELLLPLPTLILFWWRDVGVWLVAACVVFAIVACIVLRIVLGRAGWLKVKSNIPIVGPLSYWTGLAEWCSLLSVLVKHRIPLPEALQLSADGVENAYIGRLSATLAEQTKGGQTLSQLLKSCKTAPVSLVPLIRWGEKVDMLDEALATGKELFERRVKIRAFMLHSAMPPLLFLAIASCALLVVVGLFSPLVNLITALS